MFTCLRITRPVLTFAILFAAASTARAHGGGGRTYTATGPIQRVNGPALYFYGGFNNTPLTIGAPRGSYHPQYAAQAVNRQWGMRGGLLGRNRVR